LKILGDEFALSSNPNARNGGFIGLAASSIALGKVCYLNIDIVLSVCGSIHNQEDLLLLPDTAQRFKAEPNTFV
jgi:hypothetical protein